MYIERKLLLAVLWIVTAYHAAAFVVTAPMWAVNGILVIGGANLIQKLSRPAARTQVDDLMHARLKRMFPNVNREKDRAS